ncbi:IS21 family transposase [Bacillus infantis]|uniref:IS21 family transposase n=1 Tax=Bacillus infantis TaxID=324767 RepID=UPI003CFBBE62
MANIELIRKLHFKEGRSIRQLAKDLNLSRQTIRKALQQTEIPKYQRNQPVVNPVIDPVKPLILRWLEEDEHAPRKQRHSAAQIHRRLVDEYGFKGGESTIRRFVRQYKQLHNPPASSIPLEFDPGEFAQFDWGEVFILLNGIELKVMLFCMRLLFSRKIFIKVFRHQRQEALFQGHADAFDYFGGVPRTIVYDNMKTAVKKVLEGTKREEQEAFTQFRSHYLFDSQYCAPAKGNEKGQVEKLVQTARSQFLVPVPQVGSLEELNQYLKEKCDRYDDTSVPRTKEKVGERFVQEKEALLPILGTHRCARKIKATINSLSLVNFDTNYYSVPTRYSGRKDAEILAYVERVEIWLDDVCVANHERSYDHSEEIFEVDHYLDELERKPRSIQHARPLRKADLPFSYQEFYNRTLSKYGHGKEFIKLLKLHREFSKEAIGLAVENCLHEQLFTADHARHFIYLLTQPEMGRPAPTDYQNGPVVSVKPPVFSPYDGLLQKGRYMH